jgi:hypothetical protein
VELPEVTELERITFNPDDVIVARVKRSPGTYPLANATALSLRDRLREFFPVQKIIVIDDDKVKIEVMTPEEFIPTEGVCP